MQQESRPVIVRVLIVDDQAPFRAAARTVVEQTDGFEVAGEVETGEASIEAARMLAPDLILMDVNLPGIDGTEATRRILATHPQRPVIVLLSTYEAVEYAPRARECGAAGYLSKAEFGADMLAAAWSDASGATS